MTLLHDVDAGSVQITRRAAQKEVRDVEPALQFELEPRVSSMTSAVAINDRVTAYCKICKSMTEHSVTETKGKKPTPKRVSCTVCQDSHPYRASAPTPRKKATKKELALDATYDSLIAGRDASQATKYAMTHQFEDRELVAHDNFGLGLVTRVLADRKIEVRFPKGTKTLVHDRTVPA